MSIRIDGTNTAANPGITGADADTGLQFGTDEVSIVTGGTDLVTVDSSGRLLVGTSTSIVSGVASSSINMVDGGGGKIYMMRDDAGSTVAGNDLGMIRFYSNDGGIQESARIEAEADLAHGTDDKPGRLVFFTTADGASSPTERMRIDSNGRLTCEGVYDATTASAANINVNSSGLIQRSTSSIKYKTNVETIDNSYSDALLQCRPVWYRSTCTSDNLDWGWWGFIAEEVAGIDPRLVHWKTVEITYDEKGSAVETPCDPEPEGVAYDRFVPHLLNLIKRQKDQIEAL